MRAALFATTFVFLAGAGPPVEIAPQGMTRLESKTWKHSGWLGSVGHAFTGEWELAPPRSEEVVLDCRLARDGAVLDVTVVRSSGVAAIDAGAVAAVRQAARSFPRPPPVELARADGAIVVPLPLQRRGARVSGRLDLAASVGKVITLEGVVENSKIPSLDGVDIGEADGADLRGELVIVTGRLTRTVTEARDPKAPIVADRRPGVSYQLIDPATGQLAKPRPLVAILVVESAAEVPAAVGRIVTLQGVLVPSKMPTINGVDVDAADALRGQVVVATGRVESYEVKPPGPGAPVAASRGPGRYYRLVDPKTGTLAKPAKP
jgi:TonB family protein